MDNKQFIKAYEKEMKYIGKQERRMQRKAVNAGKSWKDAVNTLIPVKIHANLRAAFATAFTIVFDKGVGIIEKTYNRNNLMKEFEEKDMTLMSSRTHKDIKKFRSQVSKSNRWKSVITTAEGVGLGVLGIGLPDIVIFIGFLLQSIYEVSLKYGYDYNKPEERFLILKMMEASISKGEVWLKADLEIEQLLHEIPETDFDIIQEQIGATADAFALDMLVLKFIQGFPVVGALGGLSNPFYYSKIMDYVRLKYHKRYLIEKKADVSKENREE